MHLGYLLQFRALRWLEEQGIQMTVLFADLHARMNQKGSIEQIRSHAQEMQREFERWGIRVRFLQGSEMINADYLLAITNVCDRISLARFRRTLTIQGREEAYLDENPLSLLYAMMQLTDIFDLDVDLCLSGMDQRRIHVLAREIAPRLSRVAPTLVHLRLLNDLRAQGGKMSKSFPEHAILLNDSPEEIRRKIRKAFLAPGSSNSTLFDIVRWILPSGTITIEQEQMDADQLIEQNELRQLDPNVFKIAISEALIDLLQTRQL